MTWTRIIGDGEINLLHALLDHAARIAIERGYSFPIIDCDSLQEYLFRQPVERFRDGIKVDHVLELFERSKAKYKDPLLRKLAEADRIFFGINERKERNEKLALQLYEELADDLSEARWMCLSLYHKEYCRFEGKDQADEEAWYQAKVAESQQGAAFGREIHASRSLQCRSSRNIHRLSAFPDSKNPIGVQAVQEILSFAIERGQISNNYRVCEMRALLLPKVRDTVPFLQGPVLFDRLSNGPLYQSEF